MALWAWAESEPRWSFVVDTDSYAGNFERELSSFVVGQCDEYGEHRGGAYKEMYEKEVRGKGSRGHFEKDDPFEDLVTTRVDDHGDDAIMRAPMSLAPTPGFENDGFGAVRKVHSTFVSQGVQKPKHPAYNSVAIFLSRKPTKKELVILVERSKRFAELPPIKVWDHRPKILGMRLVEERTEIASHEIPLKDDK